MPEGRPGSGRIGARFAQCASEGRAALVGYLTAGDPDLERSRESIFAACEGGLDVLELGVPFSDPAADGPTIQAAMVRALEAGTDLAAALDLGAAVRERFELPIVLFSYANPLMRRGTELVDRVAQSGIDGLLVVDLPPEFAAPLRDPALARGLDWVGLCAPTTPERRRRQVARASTGFVYAVSVTGVTGGALAVDEALRGYLRGLRDAADVPVAVGFGVRGPEQVRALADHADGVVVGSALVRAAKAGPAVLRETVSALAAATVRTPS
jgi:tryptophan synthase alpha chain